MKEWYDIPGASKYAFNRTSHAIMNKKKQTLIRGGCGKTGYKMACLISDDGNAKTFYIHRIVGELFIEKPEGAEVINHKDLNKQNNDERNLEWVTYQQNNQHAADAKYIAVTEDESDTFRKSIRLMYFKLRKLRRLPIHLQEPLVKDVIKQLQSL